MTEYDAADLFAGPGGWDVAARDLGLSVLGIEFDKAACEIRRAAGLPTIQGDVRDWAAEVILVYAPKGLIASPPCQTFSSAGKGAGRAALDDVLLGVKTLAARQDFDASIFSDERTGLVLEPLRWALLAIDHACPFQWLAWEQVPTVLPVWEAVAEALRTEGYSVATGILNAEQYGVPQTRRRAVLVAKLDGEAKLPTPTHSRYYSRSPEKLDTDVLPWVSMTEALGWNGSREQIYVNGNQANAARRPDDKPAPTVHFAAAMNDVRWSQSPSPLIAGDPRIAPRGCKHPAPGCCANYPGTPGRQFGPGSVRVSVQEASVLQSFPDDYPWRGSKTKQFQQIGNAIPPLLARAILQAVNPWDFEGNDHGRLHAEHTEEGDQ